MSEPETGSDVTAKRMAGFALHSMKKDPHLKKEYTALMAGVGDVALREKTAYTTLVRYFNGLLNAGLHCDGEQDGEVYGYEQPRKAQDEGVPVYEMKGRPPLPLKHEGISLQLRSYGSEPEDRPNWHIVHHAHIKRTLPIGARQNMRKALNEDQDKRIGDAIEQYRSLPSYNPSYNDEIRRHSN